MYTRAYNFTQLCILHTSTNDTYGTADGAVYLEDKLDWRAWGRRMSQDSWEPCRTCSAACPTTAAFSAVFHPYRASSVPMVATDQRLSPSTPLFYCVWRLWFGPDQSQAAHVKAIIEAVDKLAMSHHNTSTSLITSEQDDSASLTPNVQGVAECQLLLDKSSRTL